LLLICYTLGGSFTCITMIAVVDSNIIYAGLYSSKGASRQILLDIRENRLVPVLTVALYEEYADVICRPPLTLSEEESNIVLSLLCKKAQLQEVFFLWRPNLKDPKDDMVLEAAVAGGVKTIITHNIKDFKGIENFDICVLTPKEYLERKKKI